MLAMANFLTMLHRYCYYNVIDTSNVHRACEKVTLLNCHLISSTVSCFFCFNIFIRCFCRTHPNLEELEKRRPQNKNLAYLCYYNLGYFRETCEILHQHIARLFSDVSKFHCVTNHQIFVLAGFVAVYYS